MPRSPTAPYGSPRSHDICGIRVCAGWVWVTMAAGL